MNKIVLGVAVFLTFSVFIVTKTAAQLLVTSFREGQVVLLANEKEQSFTIEGQGLNKFVSAQVLKNLKPIDLVHVAFSGEAIENNRARTVVFRVDKTAVPGEDYRLRLFTQNNTSITVPTRIRIIAVE